VSPGDDAGVSVYVAGIHFAIMTITSIGYGDIYPNQTEEYIVGGICQLMGGLIWASCIGSICALLTTSNPAAVRFRQTMDELNLMMASRGMTSDDQAKLRMFFINAKSQREAQAQHDLLAQMSPMVRADTAAKFLGNQVRHVWYFRNASNGMVSSIALAFNTEVFASGEAVDFDAKLGVVNRGLLLWNAAVKRKGHILGEDFALSVTLRRGGIAMAMSFIELLTLNQEKFNNILAEAPETEYRRIRKQIVRMTFCRAMIREAAKISVERGNTVLKDRVAEDHKQMERGEKIQVRAERMAKITQLQGTSLEADMPAWAKRLELTVTEGLAETRNRQGELMLAQEKLEKYFDRFDVALQAMTVVSRGDASSSCPAMRQSIYGLGAEPIRPTRGGANPTLNGRLPDLSTEGCAGCTPDVG
jgi:hypothetical protein